MAMPFVEIEMDKMLADNKVKAYLVPMTDKSKVRVLGWHSLYPGKGNTKTAMKELKSEYDSVEVHGVHTSNQMIVSYWLHMKALGLVDTVLDEDGAKIPDDFLKPSRARGGGKNRTRRRTRSRSKPKVASKSELPPG